MRAFMPRYKGNNPGMPAVFWSLNCKNRANLAFNWSSDMEISSGFNKISSAQNHKTCWAASGFLFAYSTDRSNRAWNLGSLFLCTYGASRNGLSFTLGSNCSTKRLRFSRWCLQTSHSFWKFAQVTLFIASCRQVSANLKHSDDWHNQRSCPLLSRYHDPECLVGRPNKKQ